MELLYLLAQFDPLLLNATFSYDLKRSETFGLLSFLEVDKGSIRKKWVHRIDSEKTRFRSSVFVQSYKRKQQATLNGLNLLNTLEECLASCGVVLVSLLLTLTYSSKTLTSFTSLLLITLDNYSLAAVTLSNNHYVIL